MKWTQEFAEFVAEHEQDNLDRLLFSAHRYPHIDVPMAVGQIEARRRLKNKLPEWYAQRQLVMGGRVPAEQCSSEQTARYKRRLVAGDTLCDLTGGMGVDVYYMSQGLNRAVYVERQAQLCDAARHNFAVLGATHIEVQHRDALQGEVPEADTIYVDPARRAGDGSRVYDVRDCEPDIVTWQDRWLACCRRLVVKISPMADLNRVVALMPRLTEIHVLAVKGECKEVLLVLDPDSRPQTDVRVCCVDYRSADEVCFSFSLAEEQQAVSCLATGVGRYLYEPDVTILKAGAFRTVGARFGLAKLDVNSHLYTSDTLVGTFPGRIFEVEETMPFASKTIRQLSRTLPQANITARNFPLTADQLRARSKIRDGGDAYLFASTLRGVGACLMRCRKVVLLLCLMMLAGVPALWAQSLLDSVRSLQPAPLAQWMPGEEFVYLLPQPSIELQPEQPALTPDSTDWRGMVWRYVGWVAEENWLGQPVVALRFADPTGRMYRYETPQTIAEVQDSLFVPKVLGLFSRRIITAADSLLRARTLYILIKDERIAYRDSLSAAALSEKYVPVRIDSVTWGTETEPLRVWFSKGEAAASVCLSPSVSSPMPTSATLHKCFAETDPYLRHPDISRRVWDIIRQGKVSIDMTTEEVTLALGRPYTYRQVLSHAGVIEYWKYRNGLVVELCDGRVRNYGMGR